MSQGSQTNTSSSRARGKGRGRRRFWGRRALSPQERGPGRGGGGPRDRRVVLTPGQREAPSALRVQGYTQLWRALGRSAQGGRRAGQGGQPGGPAAGDGGSGRTGEPLTPTSHCPRHRTESEGTVRAGKEHPGELGHPEPELCGFRGQATWAPHRIDGQTAVPQGGRQWPGRP